MATKSKPAAKKPAARKSVATHHKPAPAKGKVSKEAVKPHPKPAAAHPPAKAPTHYATAAKPQPKPAAPARPAVESVSLIDKKHPQKAADGETKKKTTVLPPISRIRESLATTSVPTPAKPKAPEPEPPPAAATDGATVPAVETSSQKVIHIKPPIIVKEFATQLGLKPFQLIKELMDDFTVFANQNQTIEPDVATKIAEKY